MMVFDKGERGIKQVYVPVKDGRPVQRSTGTTDPAIARKMKRMVKAFKDDHRWTILEALKTQPKMLLADGRRIRLSLRRVYDFYVANKLDQLEEAITAVDLSSYLDAWQEATAMHTTEDTAATYRMQVSGIITTPCRPSDLTHKAITSWLASAKRSTGTKRKYLYALSSFVQYAIAVGALKSDPLVTVQRPKKNRKRTRWEPLDVVKRIVGATIPELRPLAALIFGTGGEVSAVLAMKRRDVDLERGTAHIPGTKTAARDRIALLEAWARPFLVAHCRPLLPDAPLFPGVTRYRAYHHHLRACEAVGVNDLTIHDARHCLAVRWRKAGRSFEDIAAQLGNTAWEAANTYAQFVPELEERLKAAEGDGA